MSLSLRWILVSTLVFGLWTTASAEEEPKGDDAPKDAAPEEGDAQPEAAGDVAGADEVPILRECETSEAKPLVTALKKAFKSKSSNDVRKALEGIKSASTRTSSSRW